MKSFEIIKRALTLSNIISSVEKDSDQETDGLFWLNQIIQEKIFRPDFVPYIQTITRDTEANIEKYTFLNIASVDTLCFYMNGVRYSLGYPKTNEEYFGVNRLNYLSTLPVIWTCRKISGGVDIYIYPLPSQVYTLELTCRMMPLNLTMDTEMDDFFDQYYQVFLTFELAEMICISNKISLPPSTKEKLLEMRKTIKQNSPLKTNVLYTSSLSKSGYINYAEFNLGRGWYP